MKAIVVTRGVSGEMYGSNRLKATGGERRKAAGMKVAALQRKRVPTASGPKARQDVDVGGMGGPATRREIERALAADIDTGVQAIGGAVSPGVGLVTAIKDAAKAMEALVGPSDKALTVKDLMRLRAGKRAITPRGRLLLAVARLGVVMSLPCRLSEPLELLRQRWQQLAPLGQFVAQDAERQSKGQDFEIVCQGANALMDELREQAGQRRHLERRRHRLQQVERNFSSLTQLLANVVEDVGQVRVIVMEFAYWPSIPLRTAVDLGSLVMRMARDRSGFLDRCRHSSTLASAIAAYAWHLSYDFEVGPLLRIYFLLRLKGLGEHQKFIVRAGRTWRNLSQGIGVWRSDAAHPNPIVAAAHGLVAKDSIRRLKDVRKALWYEVQKEEWMRIGLPERQRAFGMSEVQNGAHQGNAWACKGEDFQPGIFGLFERFSGMV